MESSSQAGTNSLKSTSCCYGKTHSGGCLQKNQLPVWAGQICPVLENTSNETNDNRSCWRLTSATAGLCEVLDASTISSAGGCVKNYINIKVK